MDRNVFSEPGPNGTPAEQRFHIGGRAHGKRDRPIDDPDTGVPSFDADGNDAARSSCRSPSSARAST